MDELKNPVDALISDADSGAPPLESIPAGEPVAIAAIIGLLETFVRTEATATGVARRDQHPKLHGCVHAEFQVYDGLPPALAVGLFAAPRLYPAWVRYSNASGKIQSDAVKDGRGMAVKLMGVEGSPSGTQDIITVDSPAFFIRTAEEFAAFQKTAANPIAFFFPTWWNPFSWRLRSLLLAQAIISNTAANPLNLRYWSMTPYLCGTQACKFSWMPTGLASPFNDRTGDNFMRSNMAKALAAGEAVFELGVQLRTNPATQPIEDPTVTWNEAEAPFVAVGRLTIAAQDFATAERDAFGDDLTYTPWHGLEAHRPLGGINRIRRPLYFAISALRHKLNGQARFEPTPDTKG